jgi:hypothetical protein
MFASIALFLRVRDETQLHRHLFRISFARRFIENLPGTVYKWNRVLKPRTVPSSSGIKSKNNVRSVSVARLMSLPFACGAVAS